VISPVLIMLAPMYHALLLQTHVSQVLPQFTSPLDLAQHPTVSKIFTRYGCPRCVPLACAEAAACRCHIDVHF
jgi:hypothetical protein